jgi:hypothetical protein
MQQAKPKSYSVIEIVYGDSAGGYITAIGYDNYEAIGKGHPFQTALGEDGSIRGAVGRTAAAPSYGTAECPYHSGQAARNRATSRHRAARRRMNLRSGGALRAADCVAIVRDAGVEHRYYELGELPNRIEVGK